MGVVLSLAAQTHAPALTARDLFLSTESDGQIGSRSGRAGDPRVATEHAKSTAGEYLGIRYNVLVAGEPVDPRRAFVTGECFVIELESNRDGYLDVLSEGASGTWSPLVPRGKTQEPIRTTAGHRARFPATGCVELADPPGIERLFLILSPESTDVNQLLRMFQLSDVSSAGRLWPSENGTGRPTTTGPRLASRDLKLSMTDEPMSANERRFTGYAVARPPRMFVEVQLTHCGQDSDCKLR
jgi:hypothetical protein